MISDPRAELSRIAQHFYRQGWMVGTAGNLSARKEDGSIWITGSGKSKGSLSREDFILVDQDGTVLLREDPATRPSAETAIHTCIYTLFPDARACFHIHSISANIVCEMALNNDLPLPQLEMLKGLGVTPDTPTPNTRVFPNHAHVPQIAKDISDRFSSSAPRVPGFLIQEHGLTCWGDSMANAMHHIELFDYVFNYMVELQKFRSS